MDIPATTRRVGGVTLVELLIALALAGILLAGAIPNLRDLWLNNRLTTAINDLVTGLHHARSTAVTRRQRSVLCPSLDGQRCADTTDWRQGWILFVDSNATRQREDNEELLRVHIERGDSLHIHSDVGRKLVSYHMDGRAPGSNNTLVFCDERGPESARAVVISNSGRPRVTRDPPASARARCAPA